MRRCAILPSLLARRALCAAMLALAATAASSQTLDGPLRIVVGYPPGGSTDKVARFIGERLQAKLGVPVIVDNRVGAGGRLAAQQVKATPAGQNVLMLGNPAVMSIAPMVFKDNGYDPQRDFVPVSHVNSYEISLAVATAVPVREFTHLLAWLRANPEKANFGVPATGSLPHFFSLMVSDKAKVKAEVIGYKGDAPLITDLVGGQIAVSFNTFDAIYPQHEAGKVRILAVSGARRIPYASDIPTFKEAGLDLVAVGWNAFFAPATMPAARVDLLAARIREVMMEPDMQRRFIDARLQPVASTRKETEAMLKAFDAQWGPVVRKSGYQP